MILGKTSGLISGPSKCRLMRIKSFMNILNMAPGPYIVIGWYRKRQDLSTLLTLLSFSVGLVYIIDSQDASRFEESRHELVEILACDEMRNKPFIVLANKQDLPGAHSVSDIAKVLRLNEFSNAWHIQACCATTGDGLVEGFQRLGDLIKEQRRNNQRWESKRHILYTSRLLWITKIAWNCPII